MKLLTGTSCTSELAEKSHKRSFREAYDGEVPCQCAPLQRCLRGCWGKLQLGMLQRLGAGEATGCRSQAQSNLPMLHWRSCLCCRLWALGKAMPTAEAGHWGSRAHCRRLVPAKLGMLQELGPGEDTCIVEVRHCENCICCQTGKESTKN